MNSQRITTTSRLRYILDTAPGILRERFRSSFRYRDSTGRIIREQTDLERIRRLAIPPAWEQVWICTSECGHIQATGRDARGRKQYRYHASWISRRGDEKFSRVGEFGKVLPRIRKRVTADLARPSLPREKVLAAVTRLLDRTHLRVGNPEYARSNHSFGLSTLLDKHVSFEAGLVRVKFRGKGGIWHDRSVNDRRLARVVRSCRDLPGQELFQYLDDRGQTHAINSADVNDYIRQAAGGEFTAKDFRTWAGTVKAAALFAKQPPPASKNAATRAVNEVIARVAQELGNTPAICRKSYIFPNVISAFLEHRTVSNRPVAGLTGDEARAFRLLKAQSTSSRMK
jgi:DNA topoisomerase-1